MVYRVYTPGPPLRDVVDKFWSEEGYAPSHARERSAKTHAAGLQRLAPAPEEIRQLISVYARIV